MVSNPRDEMSHFVTGVSDDLVEECHDEMLHNDMNLSLLIEHAQHVEESRLKRKNNEAKRERSYNGGTSKGKFEIQDKLKLKKRFSNKHPSNFSKANKDSVPNSKPQGGKSSSSQYEKPNCAKCGKEHMKNI